jgi:hypothetical protein
MDHVTYLSYSASMIDMSITSLIFYLIIVILFQFETCHLFYLSIYLIQQVWWLTFISFQFYSRLFLFVYLSYSASMIDMSISSLISYLIIVISISILFVYLSYSASMIIDIYIISILVLSISSLLSHYLNIFSFTIFNGPCHLSILFSKYDWHVYFFIDIISNYCHFISILDMSLILFVYLSLAYLIISTLYFLNLHLSIKFILFIEDKFQNLLFVP